MPRRDKAANLKDEEDEEVKGKEEGREGIDIRGTREKANVRVCQRLCHGVHIR